MSDPIAPTPSEVTPHRITTDWRRFTCGLWRMPEGDIDAAYCADIFPKLKVFTHEGRLYTNGGCHFSHFVKASANCYPLIPAEEYNGPTQVPYSYEGKEGRWKGKTYRLGPKVVFEANDPSVSEWIQLYRVLFAEGGMFASGITYARFLKERVKPESQNEREAQAVEIARCLREFTPNSQEEMCRSLDSDSPHETELYRPQQLDLLL